jgi:hypothetical protein
MTYEPEEVREALRRRFQEKLRLHQEEAARLQAKKPFAKAKSTLAQREAEANIRAYTAILTELEKPIEERGAVAQYDIESQAQFIKNGMVQKLIEQKEL